MIVRLKKTLSVWSSKWGCIFLWDKNWFFWNIACIHKGVRFVIYCWPMLLIKQSLEQKIYDLCVSLQHRFHALSSIYIMFPVLECVCVERTVRMKLATTEALHRLLISIHRSRTADICFAVCITVPLTPTILVWRSW